MNAEVASKTEMITVVVRAEDLNLPEGNWELKSSIAHPESHGYREDHVEIRFIRNLEV